MDATRLNAYAWGPCAAESRGCCWPPGRAPGSAGRRRSSNWTVRPSPSAASPCSAPAARTRFSSSPAPPGSNWAKTTIRSAPCTTGNGAPAWDPRYVPPCVPWPSRRRARRSPPTTASRVIRCCWLVSTGPRSSRRPPATRAPGRSCAPARISSRSSSAVTPGALTISTRPPTSTASPSEGLDAPDVGDLLAWFEDEQVIGGHEGVRRAGHGLDGHCLAAAVRPQRVAGEHLQPAVAFARPQPYPATGPVLGGEVRPGAAGAVAAQPGERVVQAGGADGTRLTEVVLGAVDGLRQCGRDASVVHRQPVIRGQGQLAAVDRGRPDGQVRVRAGAVGRGMAAAVARGDGHLQAGLGIQAVLGLDLQAERVPLLAVRGDAQPHRVRVLPDRGPRRPAGQAVDGVRPGGLGEGQLVFGAAEDVPAAVDPVRPRGQQLARPGRRQLVGFVACDHRLAAEVQLTQPGAEFGHRGAVVAGLNLVLQSGKRNDHLVRIRTRAEPRGSLPPAPTPGRHPAAPRAAATRPARAAPGLPSRAARRIPRPRPGPWPRSAAATPP